MSKTKLIIAIIASLMLAFGTSRLLAQDAGKVMTITGSMVCGKCTLHECKSCQNVVQVEKDGKTVNYYLAKNDICDAMHEDVCHGDSKKVTATGTVVEKDGKMTMTVTKLEAVK